MSKRCAKCDKTVYPIEELKCLDKVWHKGCFKCWECGMTLNMKNYKGYEKLPYCSAHYPTVRHTQVAETPEMNRVTNLSKLTSNIVYHDQFEKDKGKYTVIADDAEGRRLKETQEKFSMVKYHEDFEKNIKGKKTQVDTDPEIERIKANTAVISEVQYRGIQQKTHDMESRRPGHEPEVEAPPSRNVGSISDYDPMNDQWGSIGARNSGRQEWHDTVPMGPQNPHSPSPAAPQQYQPPPQPQYQPPPQQYQPPPQQSYGRGPPEPVGVGKGVMFKAIYDYQAGDDDEVSFNDGDTVIDCEPIDEGWMIGTIHRTGKRGMLPSNYVERM